MKLVFALPMLCAALLVLSACEPTVETYEKDAELRKAKLEECAGKMLEAQNDPQCKMAMDAQVNVTKAAAGALVDTLKMEK